MFGAAQNEWRPALRLPLLAAMTLAGCTSIQGTGGEAVRWSPADRLFAPYVADPRRARFGIAAAQTDSDLEDAGDERVALQMGGRIDVLRWGGAQLDVEAGFVGDFDREESLDNLAWSGTYALNLSWLAAERLALRLGFGHESSHLGDEYVLETGRPRINYTRDELRLGASWTASPPVRLYGEYAHALHRGNNSRLKRGRAQLGAEWSSSEVRSGHPGWYAASDVAVFEENDWEASVALETGWAVPLPDGRGTWRFGALAYDGRTPIGELFDEDETRLALGIWYDL